MKPATQTSTVLPREEISFLSGGQRCDAWLYRPRGKVPYPCLVMGHGFGAIRSAGLPAFAERFAAAGMAVLVFDYRHLGTSEGEPRGLIDIPRQREDYRAAVAYARKIDGVDVAAIALWGTSFSGGHVITVAAEDPAIAAAVITNPYVDGPAAVRRSMKVTRPRVSARLGSKWLRDELRALLGKRPHRVELIGEPGATAVFTTPDAVPGYQSILPEDPQGWEPAVPARILLRLATDRPARQAPRVRCPLLVSVCENDLITPVRPAVRVAARAPRGELRRYPIGHFGPFTGEWFERTVGDQTAFLRRHLGLGGEV